MHHASCLCGKVVIEIDEIVGDYVYCHCQSCRKSSGSAFAANVSIPVDAFEVTAGAAEIKTYESTPDKVRHFCGNCASPLFTKVGDNPQFIRLRLGVLDSLFEQEAAAHIFTGSKAPWEIIGDNLQQHEEWPTTGSLKIQGSHQPDDQ